MSQTIKEQIYIDAYNKLKTATSVSDYQEIIRLLEQCEGMMDSEDLILQCRDKIENIQQEGAYQKAVSLSKKHDSSSLDQSMKLLSSLGDYKDSKSLLEQVRQKKDRKLMEGTSLAGANGLPHQAKKKTIYYVLGATALLLIAVVAGVFIHSHSGKVRSSEVDPAIAAEYSEYIQEIIDSSYGIEDGKLGVFFSEDRAWDGSRQRLLYDRYGIADIDNDGQQELILTYIDWRENGPDVIEVRRYNPQSDTIDSVVSSASPWDIDCGSTTFFNNGVISLGVNQEGIKSYVFVNKELANEVDFAQGGMSLSYGLPLNFYDPYVNDEGREVVINNIESLGDVPGHRELSVREANDIISRLEQGDPISVTMHSFTGDDDIISQY